MLSSFKTLFSPVSDLFFLARRHPRLLKVEALLANLYGLTFFPWSIWRHAPKQNFENFRFGECTWVSAFKILSQLEIDEKDHLFDLGSGRGKMLFAARLGFGLRVTGYELLNFYYKNCLTIQRLLDIDRFEVHHRDLLEADLSKATILYLATSEFNQESKQLLLENLIPQLRAGTRVISVAWPIEHERLKALRTDKLPFSWGFAPVYFFEVEPESSSTSS